MGDWHWAEERFQMIKDWLSVLPALPLFFRNKQALAQTACRNVVTMPVLITGFVLRSYWHIASEVAEVQA
jgi:hypothetical protein